MSKRKLLILKPAEVVTKLVALGFEEVRQKESKDSPVNGTSAPVFRLMSDS